MASISEEEHWAAMSKEEILAIAAQRRSRAEEISVETAERLERNERLAGLRPGQHIWMLMIENEDLRCKIYELNKELDDATEQLRKVNIANKEKNAKSLDLIEGLTKSLREEKKERSIHERKMEDMKKMMETEKEDNAVIIHKLKENLKNATAQMTAQMSVLEDDVAAKKSVPTLPRDDVDIPSPNRRWEEGGLEDSSELMDSDHQGEGTGVPPVPSGQGLRAFFEGRGLNSPAQGTSPRTGGSAQSNASGDSGGAPLLISGLPHYIVVCSPLSPKWEGSKSPSLSPLTLCKGNLTRFGLSWPCDSNPPPETGGSSSSPLFMINEITAGIQEKVVENAALAEQLEQSKAKSDRLKAAGVDLESKNTTLASELKDMMSSMQVVVELQARAEQVHLANEQLCKENIANKEKNAESLNLIEGLTKSLNEERSIHERKMEDMKKMMEMEKEDNAVIIHKLKENLKNATAQMTAQMYVLEDDVAAKKIMINEITAGIQEKVVENAALTEQLEQSKAESDGLKATVHDLKSENTTQKLLEIRKRKWGEEEVVGATEEVIGGAEGVYRRDRGIRDTGG